VTDKAQSPALESVPITAALRSLQRAVAKGFDTARVRHWTRAGWCGAFERYHRARKSLRTSISLQSRRGLDWMNFFMADVQTGFGAFVAFYLSDLGWTKGDVGLALTAGTVAALVSQIPGGALVDALRWKRALAALGIGMIGVSALILALVPSFPLVFAAEVLHGLSAGVITPAVAAISLGLVGRRAMSVRTGRNFRFDAAGNALTAGLMGLAGQYFARSAIFLGSAALCIPALLALGRIRADEIDYARARNAVGEHARSYHRLFDLGKNRNLYVFAACIFLFQLADASMLPIVGENLAQSKVASASLLMAGLIVVPQIVVALLSPWVGYHSERFGRKPLLLLGFGLEIARALLFASSSHVAVLLTAQLLGGISAAAVTVLTVLIVTDLTTGTGRFNLVRGFIGTVVAIAASISTTATGFIFQWLGHWEGFLTMTAASVLATALLWTTMPETKPGKYLD
jgi:MFS family permease